MRKAMRMLYRKRESKATTREMWCPSCHLWGVDTNWRAGEPTTGCSNQETLQKRMRMEQHRRKPKAGKDLGQKSKWEMVNTLWKRRLTDYTSPTTDSSKAARKVSALCKAGDSTTKSPEAQRTIQNTTQRWGSLLSCHNNTVNSPRHTWEKSGKKSKRLYTFLWENLSNNIERNHLKSE